MNVFVSVKFIYLLFILFFLIKLLLFSLWSLRLNFFFFLGADILRFTFSIHVKRFGDCFCFSCFDCFIYAFPVFVSVSPLRSVLIIEWCSVSYIKFSISKLFFVAKTSISKLVIHMFARNSFVCFVICFWFAYHIFLSKTVFYITISLVDFVFGYTNILSFQPSILHFKTLHELILFIFLPLFFISSISRSIKLFNLILSKRIELHIFSCIYSFIAATFCLNWYLLVSKP